MFAEIRLRRLKGLRVTRPNQVWAADITCPPMQKGFLYLVAIMDWHTRKVLAWRISNTLEAEFCVEALSEAIHRFGAPEITKPISDRSSRPSPGPTAWADPAYASRWTARAGFSATSSSSGSGGA